jgi:RNA 2',3'-cyclic 3'-phosphodiesterase
MSIDSYKKFKNQKLFLLKKIKMESLRTFIAIDVKIEKELKRKWIELKTLLRNDNIKWVDEHSLHLTLFFLGDTPSNLIDSIGCKLESELDKTSSFSIKLKGFGTFGNTKSPRVIWVGIAQSERLNLLKQTVNRVISSLGFEEQEGDFSPHFTLGRIKQMMPSNELLGFINRNKSILLQVAEVENIIFYQSVLTPNGPIYKPLKTIKLPSL